MKRYLIILIFSLCFTSCRKEPALPKDPIEALGGYDFAENSIDRFIYEHFVYPYNIEIKYRWDPSEVNLTKSIVPVMENKVTDILEVILKGWIDPYKKIAGDDFLRKYNFSKFYLAGSWEYNSNGTIVLGTAEGGVKIVLLGVNSVNKKDVLNFREYLYTIHHEFAHIIHQTKFFPQEWRSIPNNSQWYTSTWNNTTTENAQKQGFVRNYAKLNPNEDFVETIAFLLVRGQSAYDELKRYNPDVKLVFDQKEEIVVNYYEKTLGLDFRELQKEVQQSLITIAD